ncbi:hypothetical protein ONZ45_g6782 [Pleurotus djamor]|nr:hypothetical protein ONZ45_g6782 [Pleurotus djamor]
MIRAHSAFYGFCPLGKSPIITDTDTGLNLPESGAIVEYLLEKYGNGRGQPPPSGKLDNLYYLHYSEGSFLPVLVRNIINNAVRSQSPFILRPLVSAIFNQLDAVTQAEMAKHLKLVEAHLSKVNGPGYFAGGDEPTSADYMMSFPLEALAATAPGRLGPYTLKYVKMIQERPAYKKALQRGGNYTYAKA